MVEAHTVVVEVVLVSVELCAYIQSDTNIGIHVVVVMVVMTCAESKEVRHFDTLDISENQTSKIILHSTCAIHKEIVCNDKRQHFTDENHHELSQLISRLVMKKKRKHAFGAPCVR
jgi:hypothetical protein